MRNKNPEKSPPFVNSTPALSRIVIPYEENTLEVSMLLKILRENEDGIVVETYVMVNNIQAVEPTTQDRAQIIMAGGLTLIAEGESFMTFMDRLSNIQLSAQLDSGFFAAPRYAAV